MTANETVNYILKHGAVSPWLKTALRSALKRDCLRAIQDTEVLLETLNGVWEETLNNNNNHKAQG